MINRPMYRPNTEVLKNEIAEEEENNSQMKLLPLLAYVAKEQDDDKLYENFKNSFIPAGKNTINKETKPVVDEKGGEQKDKTPPMTYEMVPSSNVNKQVLEDILDEEKKIQDKFQEKYNRDIDTKGTVSTKLMVNVITKNTV